MAVHGDTLEALVMRMQDIFFESPSLILTMSEAQQRLGIDRVTCDAILGTLVAASVLAQTADGAFVRFFPHGDQSAGRSLPVVITGGDQSRDTTRDPDLPRSP